MLLWFDGGVLSILIMYMYVINGNTHLTRKQDSVTLMTLKHATLAIYSVTSVRASAGRWWSRGDISAAVIRAILTKIVFLNASCTWGFKLLWKYLVATKFKFDLLYMTAIKCSSISNRLSPQLGALRVVTMVDSVRSFLWEYLHQTPDKIL